MSVFKTGKMTYKSFGKTGLKVSIISLGNMINYRPQTAEEDQKILRVAFQNGINHIDTAELYGVNGSAESTLGTLLKKIGIDRQTVVIATKIFTAPYPDINSTLTTNRKHIRQSIDKSLARLQLDYVDILYAHFFDNETPMQEICRAYHEVIEDGKAFYWATSNWNAESVFQAFKICEKYNLHKPIGAQNQYHMLSRQDNQQQYQTLYKRYGYGLIAWSPLAGGFLTGKYLEGIKENQLSRLTEQTNFPLELLKGLFYSPYANEKTITSLKQLGKIADQLGCKITHLAIAWVLKYTYTSSALIGARNVAQLEDTLATLDILQKFTPEVEARVNKILNNSPTVRQNFSLWKPFAPIRPIAE